MLQCPYCPSKCKKSNLVRHYRRRHPEHLSEIERRPRQKRNFRSRESDQQGRPSRQLFDSDKPERHLPHLDGSRGYHQFRERGKFGSHPSHEDLGDEGKL
jgi:hypothetical protein